MWKPLCKLIQSLNRLFIVYVEKIIRRDYYYNNNNQNNYYDFDYSYLHIQLEDQVTGDAHACTVMISEDIYVLDKRRTRFKIKYFADVDRIW